MLLNILRTNYCRITCTVIRDKCLKPRSTLITTEKLKIITFVIFFGCRSNDSSIHRTLRETTTHWCGNITGVFRQASADLAHFSRIQLVLCFSLSFYCLPEQCRCICWHFPSGTSCLLPRSTPWWIQPGFEGKKRPLDLPLHTPFSHLLQKTTSKVASG